MAVSFFIRRLVFLLPALFLVLGGDANAQKARTAKTTKTATARTAKTARTSTKTAKPAAARKAKTTLVGARKTKTTKAAGKSLVATKTTARKTTKTTESSKSTGARKLAETKKTTTSKTSSTGANRAAAARKTAPKTSSKSKVTARKTNAKATSKDAKALSQKEREQIAVQRVIGRGETLVRSTPFNGDAQNPITGLGPIEVQVRAASTGKPGPLRRFFRMFSPSAERKYLVMVDAAGNATKLSERANSPIYRVFHGLMNTVPVRELVHDVVHSSGVRNGLFTAILGGAATVANPIGSIGLFRGGQLILEGIKRRTEARNKVFDATVQWAKRKGKSGHYPSLVNAYRHYKTQLQKEKPGTQPASLESFAERLAGNGL